MTPTPTGASRVSLVTLKMDDSFHHSSLANNYGRECDAYVFESVPWVYGKLAHTVTYQSNRGCL